MAAEMSIQALTRAKTNLSAGIVGLANVGKSTFFQALSETSLGTAANYPFATIDPEFAKVPVPSTRLQRLAKIYEPPSVVPATLQLVDIAGLVRGASQGQGLGNAFLSHIRSVDGLFQMVRAFDDPDIVHVEDSVDPSRDLQIIHDELVLKDMEFLLAAQETAKRKMKSSGASRELTSLMSTADVVMSILDKGAKIASKKDWTEEQVAHLRSLSLLTTKPSIFIANISEEDYCFAGGDKHLGSIKDWVDTNSPGDAIIPLSVEFESRLSQVGYAERSSELDELGVSSALPGAIHGIRKALGLQSFLTAGPQEVREWTIRIGATAPEAAGAVHTDLEKSFIQAQVTKFDDLLDLGGNESALKKAGKVQRKGKDYVVEDGDIMLFKSGNGKK